MQVICHQWLRTVNKESFISPIKARIHTDIVSLTPLSQSLSFLQHSLPLHHIPVDPVLLGKKVVFLTTTYILLFTIILYFY